MRDRSASGWALEHGRHVLEQLQTTVEGARLDQIETHIGVSVEDPILSRRPGDHREQHHAVPVDEAGVQQ